MEIYIAGDSKETCANVVLHNGRTLEIRGLMKVKLPDYKSVEGVKRYYASVGALNCHLIFDKSDEVKKQEKPTQAPGEQTPPAGQTTQAPAGEQENKETPPPEGTGAGEAKLTLPADFASWTKPQMIEWCRANKLEGDFESLSKANLVKAVTEKLA